MAQEAARVRREFDRIARLSIGYPDEDRYHEWLLRHVPRPCENALDIGCGTGSLARALAERAARVHAIDLSPGMVSAARERCQDLPNIEFAVSDFLSAEFPSDHFDCIAAVGVMHHMPWARAVERAKALLRPEGRLLIIDLFEDDGLCDYLVSGVAHRCMRYDGSDHAHRCRQFHAPEYGIVRFAQPGDDHRVDLVVVEYFRAFPPDFDVVRDGVLALHRHNVFA